VFADLAHGDQRPEPHAGPGGADAAQLVQAPQVDEPPPDVRAGIQVHEQIGAAGERRGTVGAGVGVHETERVREIARARDLERRERRPHRPAPRPARVRDPGREPARARGAVRLRAGLGREALAAARTASTIFW
jgi:hypothetical protein